MLAKLYTVNLLLVYACVGAYDSCWQSCIQWTYDYFMSVLGPVIHVGKATYSELTTTLGLCWSPIHSLCLCWGLWFMSAKLYTVNLLVCFCVGACDSSWQSYIQWTYDWFVSVLGPVIHVGKAIYSVLTTGLCLCWGLWFMSTKLYTVNLWVVCVCVGACDSGRQSYIQWTYD